jgi:hypothetical protein
LKRTHPGEGGIEVSRRVKYVIGALSLAVLVLLVVAGVAAAGTTRSAALVRVPVVGYRLQATLAPVGTATGSGRFDALLVRTGPGAIPVTRSGRVSAPRVVCPPNPRMGIPCRIGPGGLFPPVPIPPTGVHWLLVWRLELTGAAGPASASIQIGTQGTASRLLGTLCANCQPLARGHMSVTLDQARLLLHGQGYIDVQAASGELNGRIVTVKPLPDGALTRR